MRKFLFGVLIVFASATAFAQVSTASAWSSSTAYTVGQLVTANGCTWTALAAGTNQPPPTSCVPGSANSYWGAIATQPGINVSGTTSSCIFNSACAQVAATYATPSAGYIHQNLLSTSLTTTGPGLDLGNTGGWRVHDLLVGTATYLDRGISQGIGLTTNCKKIGDCAGIYLYPTGDLGQAAQSDEGYEGLRIDGGENTGWYHGTVSSTTGTGDQAVTVSTASSGNNWLTDGTFLLDIAQGTISGNLVQSPGLNPPPFRRCASAAC